MMCGVTSPRLIVFVLVMKTLWTLRELRQQLFYRLRLDSFAKLGVSAIQDSYVGSRGQQAQRKKLSGPKAQLFAKKTKKWTHWDLNSGPSACDADVIPLHHVPSAEQAHPKMEPGIPSNECQLLQMRASSLIQFSLSRPGLSLSYPLTHWNFFYSHAMTGGVRIAGYVA